MRNFKKKINCYLQKLVQKHIQIKNRKKAKIQRDLKMNIRWSPWCFDGLRKSDKNQKKLVKERMRKWEWEEDEARMRDENSERERRGLRERIEFVYESGEREEKEAVGYVEKVEREIIDFVFEYFFEESK